MSNTDEQTTQQSEEATHTSSDAWQEVGKQFQTMGESLASAFRTAWEDEQNRKRMQEMRSGLESMLNEVGNALDETAKSPQMQQAKTEMHKAAASVKVATEHTVTELRPLILDALRKLNDELAKFASRMEKPQTAAPAEPAGTAPAADTTKSAEPASEVVNEPTM